MSDVTPDSLNLRETLARIDRSLDEAAKFRAETRKLAAEADKFQLEEAAKFRAETRKLTAEADKFQRERFLAPILALVATLGAIAALAPSILRSWGAQ